LNIHDYEYPIQQCDVPTVRRAVLGEYRLFRRRCLEYLRGDAPTSVMNQVHGLAWHTAVFRTLNEARRLEPERAVNGAMWELIGDSYASLMTLGVRKLVDRDPRTDSVWNVITQIERRPELLRREHFVCYDGLPYDPQVAQERHLRSNTIESNRVRWLPTRGPEAWGTSQLLHGAFDALAGFPAKRKRLDTVRLEILEKLKAHLAHEAIAAVCELADRSIAHAERITADDKPVANVTFNTVDTALKSIVQVASFISTHFFSDAAFGSVVPVPQFDVLEHLDARFVETSHLPALHAHWHEVSDRLADWTERTWRSTSCPSPRPEVKHSERRSVSATAQAPTPPRAN
jgi:hypothetical protein